MPNKWLRSHQISERVRSVAGTRWKTWNMWLCTCRGSRATITYFSCSCSSCASWSEFTSDSSKSTKRAPRWNIWWEARRWAFSRFRCRWSRGKRFLSDDSKCSALKFVGKLFSFISGITLLGLPTEVYLHGIQYVYVVLGVLTMGFVMSVFYLPVFYGLQITSSYEVRPSESLSLTSKTESNSFMYKS